MNRRVLETGAVRANQVVIAVRGERLALARLVMGTADVSPGAPQNEFLELYGIDEECRIALQVWFDIEDLDTAVAELDAAHARLQERHPRAALENAASQADARYNALFAERHWATSAHCLPTTYGSRTGVEDSAMKATTALQSSRKYGRSSSSALRT